MVDVSKKLDKLLKLWLPKFVKAIQIDYGVGSAFTISDAKKKDKSTNMNPLSLTKKDKKSNEDIINDLVKGVNEEMSKKINYLTEKSVTDRWSNDMLAKELEGIFKEDDPNHFNYKNRFKTIARTESTRVLSNSGMNTAKRLGATGKYLVMVDDNRTSDISRALNKKYGTPEQSIALDKEFFVSVNGKEYRGLNTPLHVNDRDQVVFTFE